MRAQTAATPSHAPKKTPSDASFFSRITCYHINPSRLQKQGKFTFRDNSESIGIQFVSTVAFAERWAQCVARREYTRRSINQRIGQTRRQLEREAITTVRSAWERKVLTEFYGTLSFCHFIKSCNCQPYWCWKGFNIIWACERPSKQGR